MNSYPLFRQQNLPVINVWCTLQSFNICICKIFQFMQLYLAKYDHFKATVWYFCTSHLSFCLCENASWGLLQSHYPGEQILTRSFLNRHNQSRKEINKKEINNRRLWFWSAAAVLSDIWRDESRSGSRCVALKACRVRTLWCCRVTGSVLVTRYPSPSSLCGHRTSPSPLPTPLRLVCFLISTGPLDQVAGTVSQCLIGGERRWCSFCLATVSSWNWTNVEE